MIVPTQYTVEERVAAVRHDERLMSTVGRRDDVMALEAVFRTTPPLRMARIWSSIEVAHEVLTMFPDWAAFGAAMMAPTHVDGRYLPKGWLVLESLHDVVTRTVLYQETV